MKDETPCCESEIKKKEEQGLHKFYHKSLAKGFAESILKTLEAYVTQQEKDYQFFLGIPLEERTVLDIDWELYEQQQAAYAVNRLIENTGTISTITQYSEGDPSTAEYGEVEVKRDYFETMVISGKIFFEWKGMRAIASPFFKGNYAECHFTYAKKDAKIMKEFQEELRKFMNEHNYFKGEKLEYLSYSRLNFLKFDNIDWNGLILEKSLKEDIMLNLIFPLSNKDLCKKYNVPWRRGILIAGVPGTGKTQLGRVLCNVLEGVTVIWATSKAIHDASRVKTLFEIARKFAPSLIVMEDIDFFGHDREFITNPIVGELLTQLDGSSPNDGVFVLATTNRPQLLDRALADRPSRFDIKLIFETPALEERKKMVELFATGKTFDVPLEYIATSTDKFTGSHIKEAINYATLVTLKRGDSIVKKEDVDFAIRKTREKMNRSRTEMVS